MPNVNTGFTPPEHELAQQLEEKNHSEFVENILYYISGYIVAKLIKSITCAACKNCLISRSLSTPRQLIDHDYEGSRPDNQRASADTQFVNKGGLTIPSKSVFDVIKYADIVFKACVCKDGRQISSGDRLRSKMIVEVSNHFFLDKASGSTIFADHDPEMNDVNDDHRVKLIKHTADRYFTLRLFTYETVLRDCSTRRKAKRQTSVDKTNFVQKSVNIALYLNFMNVYTYLNINVLNSFVTISLREHCCI